MKCARRWKLSSAQRADMWDRWKAGQSLHEIGRALGKDHVVIQFLLARQGGIAPPVRRRSRLALTLAEREDISRGIASGSSMRVIAQRLRRACSTVSREVARHGGRAQYRANAADQQAWESAVRPKPCRLATHSELQQMVASKLILDWSPEQISGWLKQHYPDDESLRVSHETIYRSLFIQARGALKQELVKHLRSQRRIRRCGMPAFTGTPRAGSWMTDLFCLAWSVLLIMGLWQFRWRGLWLLLGAPGADYCSRRNYAFLAFPSILPAALTLAK
jgi:Helix-turn-helix domain